MSDDGRYAVVVIALQGNPFSPAYFSARTTGIARARDFAAFNVAIYGPNGKSWSLREGCIDDDHVSSGQVSVGRSSLGWDGDVLVARIEQRSTPLQRPLVGTVRFYPEALTGEPRLLDASERHAWCPLAPVGRVSVDFKEPTFSFSGTGYHDANRGEEGLEEGFSSWNWMRTSEGPRTTIDYVTKDRMGTEKRIHLGTGPSGNLVERLPPRYLPLRPTLWGVEREAFGVRRPDHVVTLEDGPFYARTLLRTGGAHAVHESLDAQRLRRGWVRFLTPFRMGRAG